MTAFCFFMIHDTQRSCQNDKAKLTAGKNVRNPLIKAVKRDIETRRKHTTLVDTTKEVHNDLAVAMIVDNFIITDIAVHLHHIQETENNTTAGTDHNLAFAQFLGIENGLESISKNVGTNHNEL